MNLRRAKRLAVKQGVVATYVHNALAPGLGKIGVLVALEAAGEPAKRCAARPPDRPCTSRPPIRNASTSPRCRRQRRSSASTACCASRPRPRGKPDAIIDKMVEGRIRKFYEEVVLLEQVCVIDGETKVAR